MLFELIFCAETIVGRSPGTAREEGHNIMYGSPQTSTEITCQSCRRDPIILGQARQKTLFRREKLQLWNNIGWLLTADELRQAVKSKQRRQKHFAASEALGRNVACMKLRPVI